MAATTSSDGAGKPRRRGRPPGTDSAETRAKILSAAQRLFADRGYAGVSMQLLADETGLRAAAMYHYYPSKLALFTAVAEAATERFAAEVRARVLTETTLNARMHGYLDAYRAVHAEAPEALTFLAVASREADAARRRAGDGRIDEFEAAVTPLRGFLGGILGEAITAGELPRGMDLGAAEALFDGFATIVSSTLLTRPEHFDAVIDALGLLVDGRLFTQPTETAQD